MHARPNMITLLGLLFEVINIATLMYFSPDLASDCPPWVYFRSVPAPLSSTDTTARQCLMVCHATAAQLLHRPVLVHVL